MKKRIVCVLLTLIMLVGMLPLSASAAGQSISERAITVLKQMQTYNQTCTKYGSEWRNGYGTICTLKGDHDGANKHTISEKEADKALRNKLIEVEAAVNAAGFSLSQNQFDALAVLTYDIGTSWLGGTGVLKSAIKNGLTGNNMINAFGQTVGYGSNGSVWKDSEINRRMIEANMFINGAYSNIAPSNYTCVTYDVNGGSMAEGINGKYTQYFDRNLNAVPAPVPTLKNKIFLGWYQVENSQYVWVPYLSAFQGGEHEVLIAQWQEPGISYDKAKAVCNWQGKSILATPYIYDNPKDANIIGTHTNANVKMDRDFIDAKGSRWARLKGGNGWVLISGTANGSSKFEIDVTVTVTNSTLNRRANASVTSKANGTYKKGDQLRIITTEMGSGLLWGQVADEYGVAVGWVALRYTNWDQVKDNPVSNNTTETDTDTVATAVINCAGYLNVRSEAGTDNAIVGALADGDHVNIYEFKFVNGHQWGRTDEGWILLTYAKVDLKDNKMDMSTAADVLAYTYTGTLKSATTAHTEAAHNAQLVGKEIAAGTLVAISMVKNDEIGNVWGFNGTGWLPLESVIMDVAKYVVVSDSVSVRSNANSASNTVEKVVKGVELDISEIAVVDATIWGKTEKYGGWVNLASKYVQRSNAPVIENVESNNYETGLLGTVVNTGSVNVRTTGAIYGEVIGSLSAGTTVKVWADEGDGWYKVDSNGNGVRDYEDDGWVSAKYLNVYQGTIGGDEDSTDSDNTTGSNAGSAVVETGLGIVANTYTGVNIRQGAGTGYAANGKYLTGTAVEILEVTSTATSKWGRTEKGWVCMDYITMVSKYPIGGTTTPSTPETDPNAGQNVGGSSSKTEGNTTISSTPAVYAGVVVGDNVPVLKTADVDAIEISKLSNGQNITIQELVEVKTEITVAVGDVVDGNATTQTFEKTITTTYWARVNGGWVKDPATNLKLNTLDERTYTVVDYAEVNVRDSAAGTIITDIDKGTQVAITELEIVNDKVWGFAEDLGNGGWVRLDMLAEGGITINTAPSTPAPTPTEPTFTLGNTSNVGGYVNNDGGYRYTGKVINADAVNVRALPTTNSNVVIQLKYGQSLVIYETTIAENMAWGRCDAGWVYLYYVDLTPVVNGAVDARVVYNENTVIYSDVNCSGTVGTYARMSVIDIYEIVGTMARTDKGWVSTNDLL